MKILSSMFVVAALAFAGPAQAQNTATPIPPEVQRTVDQLRASALASDKAYEIVESLVTEVGPRLAGSPAEARAREWAQAMLTREGFSNVRIEPFNIRYWDGVSEKVEIVGPQGARPLVAVALGGSAPTPAGGVEGDLVRFSSLAALNAANEAQVRGRIVFIDEMMTRTQDGSGYGAAVAKRGGCAQPAQARGAIACLIRSVGTDAHRFAHQGGSARQPDGVSLPAVAVSPADADVLARLVAQGGARVRISVEAELRNDVPSGNVIGDVRGRERPNEIVLLAAHLDSWDSGHGALDDGAGVAIITAAAKLIRDLPRRPRRTIRVLFAGAEENAGRGDIAYWAAHGSEPHVLASESDFGAGRVWRVQSLFDEASLPHFRAIHGALAPLGVGLGRNAANGGADISALREAGVAILDLDQDGSDYFDYHHTPDDTLDKIDREALRQNVAAWATAMYLAAEMDWTFKAPAAPVSQ